MYLLYNTGARRADRVLANITITFSVDSRMYKYIPSKLQQYSMSTWFAFFAPGYKCKLVTLNLRGIVL